MGRFIIVTFIFLGWAFYQLSGGSGFDADATRQARIDAPSEVNTAPLQASVVEQAETPEPEAVALDLATVDEVLAPKRSFGTQATRVSARIVPQSEDSLTEDATEEDATLVLPSLIVNAVPEAEATVTPVDFSNPDATAPSRAGLERRTVTGSRVNVRGGPGTDYQVVNRLVRGDQVEILEDPGNGWVRMRPVSGGTVGWLADFLLTES